VSPIRTTLYRRARWAVIWVLVALSGAQITSAQLAKKAKKDSGPRAVGLVELSPDGKARLIPIAIMVDGKFYDASAYKASPVPMAIWGQTVYEAERNGVSLGLFTVGGAMHAGNYWFAEGQWQPAGSAPKKKVEKKPRLDDDDSGPPRLRRPESEKAKSPSSSSAPETKAPSSPPPASSPSASTTPASTNAPATAPAPQTPSAAPSPTAAKNAPDKAAPDEDQSPTAIAAPTNPSSNDEDPNRPVLVRGKIETLGSTQHAAPAASASGSKSPASKSGAPAMASSKATSNAKTTQLIPAISDAGGPDPRPYAYDLKANEEEKWRKQMLAMAADLIGARAHPGSPAPVAPAKTAARPGTATRRPPKSPPPTFDDVQFHAFDLWNTNEPVFVLSAQAQMPKTSRPSTPRASASGSSTEPVADLTYYITLVVKEDIYGDLRKLNATVTDTQHLDETPRLELIDAVDADGDGRGELLFRQISEAGSAWGIYRAGADQLFPLFEGTP
jgi:hypothetical protein